MLLFRQFELAFYISHHVFVLLGKGVLIVLLVDSISNGLDHSLRRQLHLTVRHLVPHNRMYRNGKTRLVFGSIIRDVVRFDVSYLLVRAVIQAECLFLRFQHVVRCLSFAIELILVINC